MVTSSHERGPVPPYGGHPQGVPRSRGQRRRGSRGQTGGDSRSARRERRGEEYPDEDPVRALLARRWRNLPGRAASRTGVPTGRDRRRGRDGPPALHAHPPADSCGEHRPRRARASERIQGRGWLAPGIAPDEPARPWSRTTVLARARDATAADPGPRRPVRVRHRRRNEDLGTRRRPATARRDSEGTLPRRRPAHSRRTHCRSHPQRGRTALRLTRTARTGGDLDYFHHTQAQGDKRDN